MNKILIALAIFLTVSCVTRSKIAPPNWEHMETVFSEAHDTIQTSVYWYWISDNISKEGVIKDLHAMKKVGINRAFIGHIGLDDIPKEKWGNVKLFSEEWWEILRTACATATELGIDIGMFNGPGWSQSGGPWIKEDQSMRYLHRVDTIVKGARSFNGKIAGTPANFQPTNVIAFPLPKDYRANIADQKLKVNSDLKDQPVEQLFVKGNKREVVFPNGKSTQITFSADQPFTARSLTIYPSEKAGAFNVTLEVLKDGEFSAIKTYRVDRTNPAENVGFDAFAPAAISFEAVESSTYRIIIDQTYGQAGVREIELKTIPIIERFEEKTFAKMHPTPLPFWHHYMWPKQAEVDASKGHAIAPEQVVDLTQKLSADGSLLWDVPEGEWMIMQMGMLPTGAFNAPASELGRGIEVDKMSTKHVASHFDNFIGEIIRRIPAEDRKSFKVVVQDSYETGGQNWTDDFEEKFVKAFGYDPKPYLPTYYGLVVGSQEQSDRFLWDMRRFVADQVAYEYVGGFRKISHEHGLTTWLENYGHWGFPGEFLQYGGQSDEVGGEFWSEGNLGDIENRAASSAAHIYGKNKVSAESFTSAGNFFGRYPAMFKERGDRFFAEGINNTLLHVYIHQPYEDKLPGVNAWFGNDFNRLNTWFYEMGGFISYLKRTNYMLQQGTYVADVAYFIGEDTPKMTGEQNPALPNGYDFDYMNAEVIMNRMEMKDGRFTLPDGLSYKILVLPPLETIRPELLEKIEKLVKDGGVILGSKPSRSPSLQNFKDADERVRMLANKLWGNIDGNAIKQNTYGKGLVLNNMSLEDAFALLDLKPDFKIDSEKNIHYLHRKLQDGDMYFLSNQSGQEVAFEASFRSTNKTVELWDALSGRIRNLPECYVDGSITRVPLELASQGSAFVIFRNKKPAKASESNERKNFVDPDQVIAVEGEWKVTFINPDSSKFTRNFDQLADWSKHADDKVKYFSGSAHYEIDVHKLPSLKKKRVVLNIGQVGVLASVTINGKEVGSVWTDPYSIDITSFCQSGSNHIDIRVTNTWVNSLIGDQQKPEEERKFWTIVNPYKKDSALHKAGLLGPVTFEIYSER